MAFENNPKARRGVLSILGLGMGAAFGIPYSNAMSHSGTASRGAEGREASRQFRSFEEFGARPDGAISQSELRSALERAWSSALERGHDLYHPGGVYDIGDRSFPWHQPPRPKALLDCKNVTIFGNGPSSIFKTTSDDGADVFQLNGLKNLHFRNLALTADLTGFKGSGSNGISITDGYDNITLLDIWCDTLPSVDKGHYIDGGKALTLQCNNASLEVGSLTARIFAKGCAQGFGFEAGLVRFLDRKVAVEVEIVAEDCFVAVSIGGPDPTAPLPEDLQWGVRVKAQAINCQRDVWLARAFGVDVDCQTISTKTAGARRTSPTGKAWFAADSIVDALLCAYAKNSRIHVSGNKGECDYKARIGGATAGNGMQLGASTNCDIFLDLGGRHSREAVAEVDSGGNSLSFSTISVTPTTGKIPEGFYLPVRDNLIFHGSRARLPQPSVSGPITLVDRDGRTPIAELKLFDGGIAIRQLAGSGGDKSVLTVLNDKGMPVAAFRNDGAMMNNSIVAASATLGEVVGVKPEYDSHNNLRGYSPLYRGYKPR